MLSKVGLLHHATGRIIPQPPDRTKIRPDPLVAGPRSAALEIAIL
jgi:hypothetical protein